MKYIHSILIIFFSIITYANYTIIEAKYGKEALGNIIIRPDVRAYLYLRIENNKNKKISSVFIYKFFNSNPPFIRLQYHLINNGFISRQSNKPTEEEIDQHWHWNDDLQKNEPFEEKLSNASIKKLFEMFNEIKKDTIPDTKPDIDCLENFKSFTSVVVQT